jgi:hypothetical protein
MEKVLGELVTFKSSRGLNLDGILFQDNTNKTTIIHVHGSLGNFYQNKFIRKMAKKYLENNINLLSFNTSCHDGFAEGFRYDTEFEYIGGSIADFNETVYDIDGAICFSKQFSDNIILQGHSLGCDRIVNYTIVKNSLYDIILLSPCDSYQLQSNWLYPETIDHQILRLKEQMHCNEIQWLQSTEYGVKQEKEIYKIPITLKTLLSIMEGPPFKLFRINKPFDFYINQKAIIYIGGKDPLQTDSHDVMFNYFEKRFKSVEKLFIATGDHDLGGCEDVIIDKIVKWADRVN